MVRIIPDPPARREAKRPSLRYSRPAPMPSPHARFTIVLMVSAALVLACGQSTSPSSPTPIPLTPSQIQARYTAAAPHYNQGEAQVAATENAACDAISATVSLGACQTALSLQRQLTIAYDNALRAIPFGGDRRHRRSPPPRRRRRHREAPRAGRDRRRDRDHRHPPAAGHPAAGHRRDGRVRAAIGDRPARRRLTGELSGLIAAGCTAGSVADPRHGARDHHGGGIDVLGGGRAAGGAAQRRRPRARRGSPSL